MDYTIKSGDTLSALARKNNVSIQDIMKANPTVTDANKIYAGKSLLIPQAPKTNTIQTTTSVRAQDQTNLNSFNSASQQIQMNNTAATAAASAQPQQSTQDVKNGNVNTPPPMSAESLYLTGDMSAESVFGKLSAQPLDPKNPEAKPVTLQDVQAKIGELDQNPASRAQAELYSSLARLEKDNTLITSRFEEFKKTMDIENQAAVDSINATFTQRRAQLEGAYTELKNSRAKAGYATDSFKYTPQLMEGLVTNDEMSNINALAALDAEMRSALAQAATAKREGDWELLGKMMDMYNKNNTERTGTVAKLISLVQENNKKTLDELKIAEKVNKMPTATEAKTLATSVAPAMLEAIKGMNPTQQAEYIKTKADALKIDVDTLNSAVLTAEEKAKLDQQKLEHQKALTDKANRPAGSGGGGTKTTLTEKKTGAFTEFEEALARNKPNAKGIPVVDPNGYFTPEGFKALLTWGIQNNIKREEIIKQYKGRFNRALDVKAVYGLSTSEKNLIK